MQCMLRGFPATMPRKCRMCGPLFVVPESDFRSPETLRPQGGQSFAVQVEVYQREGCQQPFVILLQPPVSHFGKSEHALQDAEGPCPLGSYSGLGPVLASCFLIHSVFVLGSAAGHILRLRRCRANRIPLALITSVAPHLLFLPVQ